MNKKFLKHYMETNPEGTAQTYIFLVDNQDGRVKSLICKLLTLHYHRRI
ncbi:hypothetical protein [Laedolimicola sp.]